MDECDYSSANTNFIQELSKLKAEGEDGIKVLIVEAKINLAESKEVIKT